MSANDEGEEDVVWRDSPLFGHLQDLGLLDDVSIEDRSITTAATTPDLENDPLVFDEKTEDGNALEEAAAASKIDESQESALLCSARSFMWPQQHSLVMEVKVARAILESELLVQEDEEFLNNFVLNDEILTEFNSLMAEKPSHFSSVLSDVVLFSGSVAAVAGAVLYLSEKAKAATAAAALLPTALAAMTSVRIGNKVNDEADAKHFHQIIELLLTDMKRFKQLVRKSLNLLQGMEMISQGNFLSVDPKTGASMSTTSTTVSNGHQQQANNPSLGTDFPALRHAALKCTLQIIESYREAVAHLMEISPLAEHVDMREHYIAFVDLETFGLQSSKALESSSSDQQRPPIGIRELKETAQIALVQQSEYLRRFSLAFCDRVREDNTLNKAGVLKHIRDLLVTIRKINDKLSTVLEYHQAMGFDMEKSRALMPKSPVPNTSSRSSQKFVPLRSIYTSMFSTGLHLQHTLLKLRRLERLFEDFEKGHHGGGVKRGRKSPPIPVDEVKLLQWLGDFQEIQAELNACIGCLDDGVTQISSLRHKDEDNDQEKQSKDVEPDTKDNFENGHHKVVDEQTESPTFDEVFEAYIAEAENEVRQATEQLDEVDVKMAKQSTRLMKELKGVLVHKAKEHEVREAKALSRQRGEDPFLFDSSSAFGADNKFEDSFVNEDSASDSSSNPSDCPTVRSASPKNTASSGISNKTIARSVSGQFLDSDDEETASESCGASRSRVSEDHQNGGDNQLQLPISGLRSLSTPDLKNMDPTAAGSYKAFAAKEEDEDTLTSSSSSSSSGWESADELETTQHPLQSYRRPLPPPNHPPAKDSPKKKLKAKRQRNRSNVNNGNASLYFRLNEKAGKGPLSIPDQRNFDGGIAMQAASLALAMRNGKNSTQVQDEQVFGDSDDSSS